MKKLLVLTAVSVILVASGSAMADPKPPVDPAVGILNAIGPMAVVGIAPGIAGGVGVVGSTSGSSALGVLSIGQNGNMSSSATSGSYDTSTTIVQNNATTKAEIERSESKSATNSGSSSLASTTSLDGTQVSVDLKNVANNSAGLTTTQGIENTGTIVVAATAAALPSSRR